MRSILNIHEKFCLEFRPSINSAGVWKQLIQVLLLLLLIPITTLFYSITVNNHCSLMTRISTNRDTQTRRFSANRSSGENERESREEVI